MQTKNNNSNFSTRIVLISTTIMLIIEFYVIRIPSIYIEIEEHKCNPTKIIGKKLEGIIWNGQLYNGILWYPIKIWDLTSKN